MPFVKGFLRITHASGHPDHDLPEAGPGHPDQGLPDEPIAPDHELPSPPPGVWPPPSAAHPIVPAPPDTPPGAIWPPMGHPPRWGGGIPATPARPDQGLPSAPVRPSAPDQPPGKFWIVAGIPGVGWRYVCVDASLIPQPK